MKAVVFERFGEPAEVLQVREVPDPEPGEGQVLVDVEAVGVNFRDVYEREGRPPYSTKAPAIVGVAAARLRGPERLAATAAEIASATGSRVVPVTADVATREGQAALLAACPEPDILVNNNAGPPLRDFRELTVVRAHGGRGWWYDAAAFLAM